MNQNRIRPLPFYDLQAHKGITKLKKLISFLDNTFELIANRRIYLPYSYRVTYSSGDILCLSFGNYSRPTPINLKLIKFLTLKEDQRFFSHCGFDILGTIRAIGKNLAYGQMLQGGSTLTQQLIRNLFISQHKTLLRKIIELILALKLEKHYTKEEILKLYTDHVYLGGGVRGFEAAAKVIYRRPLSMLTDMEVASLIGLLRAPSKAFPFQKNKEIFAQRTKFIAKFLEIEGKIKEPNVIQLAKVRRHRIAAQAASYRECGELDIAISTISKFYQSSLDKTLAEFSRDTKIKAAAGIMLSTRDSSILAESCWQRGAETCFSPSFDGCIQPGSTLKPFAVIAALEQGLTLDYKLLSAPYNTKLTNGKEWNVRNYADIYHGNISLQDALIFSDNTAFARLIDEIGEKPFADVLKRFGLVTEGEFTRSAVLGALSNGISLQKIALSYAAIARMGVFKNGRMFSAIKYANGGLLPITQSPDVRVINSWDVALKIQGALQLAAKARGITLFSGKTGTTKKGSLFAGYNDEISISLWIDFHKEQSERDPKGVTATSLLSRLAHRLHTNINPSKLLSI